MSRLILKSNNFMFLPETTSSSNVTTSGTAPSTASTEKIASEPNVGAIVVGVIGGVALVAILAGTMLFLLRRRNRVHSRNALTVDFPGKQDRRLSQSNFEHQSRLAQELPPSKYAIPPGSEAEGSHAVYEASEDTRPQELA